LLVLVVAEVQLMVVTEPEGAQLPVAEKVQM
jgi:hypothetical protein